jgi:NAD(P)-dependent dehydrogenase (short-subunit alcohol dehydrogenase family)
MSKTFLLTGSSRGLGRAISIAILEAGHRLVATARKPGQLDELVARYGDRILPVQLDVTDFDAAKNAVERGVQMFGSIDVVINNAGFGSVASVEDMPMTAIRAQFDTNFMGSVHVIKAALPHLREQGAGRIIQVTSIGARIATAGAAAYYASKWALAGFIESLALEVGPLGIKVTAVEPGGMKTDFADDSSLTIFPSSPAYEATAGATAAWMKAPGFTDAFTDPRAMAALLVQVADMDEPPLRLLAGADSVQYAGAADDARRKSDEQWKSLSMSVSSGA